MSVCVHFHLYVFRSYSFAFVSILTCMNLFSVVHIRFHLLRVHPSSFALILTIETHVKIGLNSKMPSRFPPVMFYKTHTLTDLGAGKHDSARLTESLHLPLSFCA